MATHPAVIRPGRAMVKTVKRVFDLDKEEPLRSKVVFCEEDNSYNVAYAPEWVPTKGIWEKSVVADDSDFNFSALLYVDRLYDVDNIINPVIGSFIACGETGLNYISDSAGGYQPITVITSEDISFAVNANAFTGTIGGTNGTITWTGGGGGSQAFTSNVFINITPGAGTVDIATDSAPTSLNFSGNTAITEVASLDTTNTTILRNCFNGCTNLVTVTSDLAIMDTSEVTDFVSMFQSCSALTTVPLLVTTKGTNFNSMFRDCSVLTTIPLFDFSNVDQMVNLVRNCTLFDTFPALVTGTATRMENMFMDCPNIVTIPDLDASSATALTQIFLNCTSLTNAVLVGATVSVNYADTLVNVAEMDAIFTALGTASGTQTITKSVAGAGATDSIATNKGWTVI